MTAVTARGWRWWAATVFAAVSSMVVSCAAPPSGDALPTPASVPPLREPMITTGPADPAGPTVPDLRVEPPAAGVPAPPLGPIPLGPVCTFGQLRISPGDHDGGMDHGGSVLLFRNTGRPCRLQGHPTVELLDAHGHVEGHAVPDMAGYLLGDLRDGAPIPVYLATGATVSASVEGIRGPNVGPGGQLIPCPLPVTLRITPPGAHEAVTFKAAPVVDIGDGCGPQVHPVVGGTTGSIDH